MNFGFLELREGLKAFQIVTPSLLAPGNRTTSYLSALHRYEAANHLLEDDTFTYTHDANGNLTVCRCEKRFGPHRRRLGQRVLVEGFL